MGYDRKRHYNAAAADRSWVDDGSRSAKESRAMSSQPESLMMKSSDVTGDVTLPQQLLSWQQAPSVHDSAWHSVLQTMTVSAAEPLSWLPPPSSTQHWCQLSESLVVFRPRTWLTGVTGVSKLIDEEKTRHYQRHHEFTVAHFILVFIATLLNNGLKAVINKWRQRLGFWIDELL